MAEAMFDGFDHTRHQAEVEERWGKEAYARADAWWRGMGGTDRDAWKRAAEQLSADWKAAAESGGAPDSPAAQEVAARHVRWLAAIPGTPAADGGDGLKACILGLGELYVADPRFAANWAGATATELLVGAYHFLSFDSPGETQAANVIATVPRDGTLPIAVGALLDFLSGAVPRAPLWMRRLRLEWLFRLAVEPGRLWRRYMVGNPLFLWRVARQKFSRAPAGGAR